MEPADLAVKQSGSRKCIKATGRGGHQPVQLGGGGRRQRRVEVFKCGIARVDNAADRDVVCTHAGVTYIKRLNRHRACVAQQDAVNTRAHTRERIQTQVAGIRDGSGMRSARTFCWFVLMLEPSVMSWVHPGGDRAQRRLFRDQRGDVRVGKRMVFASFFARLFWVGWVERERAPGGEGSPLTAMSIWTR